MIDILHSAYVSNPSYIVTNQANISHGRVVYSFRRRKEEEGASTCAMPVAQAVMKTKERERQTWKGSNEWRGGARERERERVFV